MSNSARGHRYECEGASGPAEAGTDCGAQIKANTINRLRTITDATSHLVLTRFKFWELLNTKFFCFTAFFHKYVSDDLF